MTEPTDAELLALIEKHLGFKPRRDDTVIDPRTGRFHDVQRYRDMKADILAKWGTPPAVAGEPVAWRYVDARGHFRYAGYKPCRDMAAEYPLLKPIRLYDHPSPPEGMVAEQALRKVLSVVRRYLPPDGLTAHDAMTEITEIVDPWPLGPLEKP